MSTLLILYLFSGLLLSALSIPLILRMIKPNGLYGFRIKQTMENPDLWYEVNVYSGWRLLWTGLAVLFTSVVLYFIPGIGIDAYALGCLAVVVLFLVVGLVQSFRYISTLEKKQK